jgi:ubiquinone biosynthesis protein
VRADRRWVRCADDVPDAPDFRALARAAGLGWASRLGLLLHPTFGPWIGLRAAVFVPERLAATPLSGPSPCADCPAPCVAACPAAAIVDTWDAARCLPWQAARDTCHGGCLARSACPARRPARRARPMRTISVQDLGRVRTLAQVFAKHGFGHVLGRVDGLDLQPADDAPAPTTPLARRLRNMLVELGPTFVKLGQVLSLRPDILPGPILAEFQKLQHEVEPMPLADVLAALAESLGRPVDEVFASFDPVPLGAASIAQVHAATLIDGRQVAVKVQRRGIEPVIGSDLHILYTLAGLVEGRVALPGLHTPTAIVREFDAAIHRELDFVQEADAMARMARQLDGAVIIPDVLRELCSRRVLVMQRIDGAPLSASFDRLDLPTRRRLAHQLMEITYQQVFEHGFFHGDPHPGNLLVTPSGQLALLDFGVTGLLTGSMQDLILQTFTAMVFRDADTLALTIYRAGATRERIDLREFRSSLERKMVEYHGASLDDLASRDTLVEVVEMATRFNINLPAEFAVLSRALALIEGNIRRLLPDIDIVAEVRPYAERLVKRLQGQLGDLPTQVSQTLLDLDAGRLTIVTRDPDAALLRETLRIAAIRVSLAVTVGTAGIGAVLWLPHGAGDSALRDAVGWTMLLLSSTSLVWLVLHLYLPGTLDAGAWRRAAWQTWTFFRRRP